MCSVDSLAMSWPNPWACPNPPYCDPTSAPQGAGRPPEDKRRVERRVHMEAAELVTKQEILLIRRGVGTVIIECEMMVMVHKTEASPIRYRLITRVRNCNRQQEKEQEKGESQECSRTQCWREERLARKLLMVWKRVVAEQLKQAKRRLAEEVRFLVSTSSKEQAETIWTEVRDTRRETWIQLHPHHQ